jgi:hypothetical protein
LVGKPRWVIGAIFSSKRLHYSVNLLSFAWKPKFGQEISVKCQALAGNGPPQCMVKFELCEVHFVHKAFEHWGVISAIVTVVVTKDYFFPRNSPIFVLFKPSAIILSRQTSYLFDTSVQKFGNTLRGIFNDARLHQKFNSLHSWTRKMKPKPFAAVRWIFSLPLCILCEFEPLHAQLWTDWAEKCFQIYFSFRIWESTAFVSTFEASMGAFPSFPFALMSENKEHRCKKL